MASKDDVQIVKIYVKSKRVAVRSVIIEQYAGSIIGHERVAKRIVEYEDELDETQKAMVECAKDLAAVAGFTLKILDVSKQSKIKKILGRVFGRPHEAPTIVFSDAIFFRAMKG
jgi:hypothetical protein